MFRADQPRLLVLDGLQQQLRVALDGRALSITRPDDSVALVPLARIDRIMSRGDILYSAQALTAAAQSGTLIAFLRGDGTMLAVLAAPQADGDSARATAPDRHRKLEVMLTDPRGSSHLKDFIWSEISRAALAAHEADPALAARLGPPALAEALRLALKAAGMAPTLGRNLTSFMALWVRQRCAERGMAATWCGLDPGRRPDLAAAFATILGWRALPLLRRQFRKAHRSPAHDSAASPAGKGHVALYWAELLTPRLQRNFDELFHRFDLFLDEMHRQSSQQRSRIWDG